MAYDAGILNQGEKETTMNVLGEQQSQDTPDNALNQATVGGTSQQATIQPGQAAAPPKSSAPRSGLFTNIKQYIQRNKPKAGQLATSAAEAVTAPASEVSEAVQQQQQQYKQNIANLDTQRQQAQQQAQDLVNRSADTGAVSVEEVAKFKQLTGGDQRFDNVKDFDTTQSQYKLDEAKRIADQSQNAQGRKDLLRRVFGQEGQRYSKGQQSLDNLLLQTTKAGREDLSKGLYEKIDSARGVLSQAQEQAKADKSQLTTRQQAMQKALQDYVGSKFGGAQAAVEADKGEIIARQRAQQATFGDMLNQVQSSRDAYESEISDIRNALHGKSDLAAARALTPEQLSSLGLDPSTILRDVKRRDYTFEDPTGNVNIGELTQSLRDQYGGLGMDQLAPAQSEYEKFLGVKKEPEIIKALRSRGVKIGTGEEYNYKQFSNPQRRAEVLNAIVAKEQAAKGLLESSGINLTDLKRRLDPRLAEKVTYDEPTLARFNALARLSGQEQRASSGSFNIPQEEMQRVQDFLNKYKGGAY